MPTSVWSLSSENPVYNTADIKKISGRALPAPSLDPNTFWTPPAQKSLLVENLRPYTSYNLSFGPPKWILSIK
jgi:hypothetical protein